MRTISTLGAGLTKNVGASSVPTVSSIVTGVLVLVVVLTNSGVRAA